MRKNVEPRCMFAGCGRLASSVYHVPCMRDEDTFCQSRTCHAFKSKVSKSIGASLIGRQVIFHEGRGLRGIELLPTDEERLAHSRNVTEAEPATLSRARLENQGIVVPEQFIGEEDWQEDEWYDEGTRS